MNENIKVSVVIPIYNVLPYLRTCLDSLTAQTIQESEFIMVSDGASEEECSICNEYVAKDSRFKFFRREHAGVSATRNYGVAQARGEYITFVDSDDWIAPGILEEAYELSKEKDCDVTFWNYVQVSPQKRSLQKFSLMNSGVLSKEMLITIRENLCFVEKKRFMSIVVPWGKLYRASLVRNIPFEEDIESGEDRIFNLQIFLKDVRVVYLNRDSYFYRRNDFSITNKYRHNAFDVLMKGIRRLDDLTNGEQYTEICNETLYKFVESLSRDYFHKDNPFPFKENIDRLKQIFYSEMFRNVVNGCSFRKLNKCHKIDYLFIKCKIFPWLYIRTVLFSLKRNFFSL